MNVGEHFLHFLCRLCNQDDVVGKDQVGEVLTVCVNSFLIPFDLTDDGLLEAGCEELWRDVVIFASLLSPA